MSANPIPLTSPPMRRRVFQRGQWSLIGLLVTITIIMILAAWYTPIIAGRHSAPGDKPTPIERAYGTACSEYEGQMNQAVTMYEDDHDGRPPRRIAQLKKYGVTDDMIYAEGCHFVIDKATGQVKDDGHGRYIPPPQRLAHRFNGFNPDHPEIPMLVSYQPPPPASYGGSSADQNSDSPGSQDDSSSSSGSSAPSDDQGGADNSGDGSYQPQQPPPHQPGSGLQIPGAPGVRIPTIPVEGL